MNKIQELAELQSKASEISQAMVSKLEDLSLQTDKYVFSVDFKTPTNYKIVINKKGQEPITIEMDSENAQKLHVFLSNVFDEEKIVKKVEKGIPKQL